MSGQCRNFRPRIIMLHSYGVKVRLYSIRRLHCKVLLTEMAQYIGSLNWTDASLRNEERAVRLHLLGPVLERERAWFDALWAEGKKFTGEEEEPITPQR